MPGAGIPGFADTPRAIARAGIYDFAVHHDQILVPVVLRTWKVEELTGLTPAADVARDRLPRRAHRAHRAPRSPPGRAPRERAAGGHAVEVRQGMAIGHTAEP